MPLESAHDRPPLERPVHVPINRISLDGDLIIPSNARGIVLFAHGSGSSRFSPRNRYVARVLQQGDLATLLLDLLTPEEEEIDQRTRRLRFDIHRLSHRLALVTDWLDLQPDTHDLPLGYFGASTGAAAALVAASERPQRVKAVVSRGGRPDLAGPALEGVVAPTLLLVGGEDVQVIDLNQEAMRSLTCDVELRIIPGATHLFEEPGTLEEVAHQARDWFRRYLPAVSQARQPR